MFLLVNMAYAGGEQYFIKLGSFKNLKGLERSIKKLPYRLRSHVKIVRKNSWYVPFAYYTKRKSSLTSKVAAYKRYFPDAHINRSKYMLRYKLIRNYGSKRSKSKKSVSKRAIYVRPPASVTQIHYQNVAISTEHNSYVATTPPEPIIHTVPSLAQPIPTPTVSVESSESITQKQYKNFTKQMLSGKHYYLAYKSPKGSPDLLIKVSFGTHTVNYQPMRGDMQMRQANYLIEDDKLYMFADNFTKDGAYSILDEHRDNHFLVSSWVNGKKLNTLRYYYHLNDAQEYLGVKPSTGLASTLAEGSFDEFFLNDEDFE
jgi:hypothetical protein